MQRSGAPSERARRRDRPRRSGAWMSTRAPLRARRPASTPTTRRQNCTCGLSGESLTYSTDASKRTRWGCLGRSPNRRRRGGAAPNPVYSHSVRTEDPAFIGTRVRCQIRKKQEAPNRHAYERFFHLAVQYYVAARFAARAHLIPVSGNLYHHAIEMMLKAQLSRSIPLQRLWKELATIS